MRTCTELHSYQRPVCLRIAPQLIPGAVETWGDVPIYLCDALVLQRLRRAATLACLTLTILVRSVVRGSRLCFWRILFLVQTPLMALRDEVCVFIRLSFFRSALFCPLRGCS